MMVTAYPMPATSLVYYSLEMETQWPMVAIEKTSRLSEPSSWNLKARGRGLWSVPSFGTVFLDGGSDTKRNSMQPSPYGLNVELSNRSVAQSFTWVDEDSVSTHTITLDEQTVPVGLGSSLPMTPLLERWDSLGEPEARMLEVLSFWRRQPVVVVDRTPDTLLVPFDVLSNDSRVYALDHGEHKGSLLREEFKKLRRAQLKFSTAPGAASYQGPLRMVDQLHIHGSRQRIEALSEMLDKERKDQEKTGASA